MTKKELERRIENIENALKFVDGGTKKDYLAALEVYGLALKQLEDNEKRCLNCEDWLREPRDGRVESYCVSPSWKDLERVPITNHNFCCRAWRGKMSITRGEVSERI